MNETSEQDLLNKDTELLYQIFVNRLNAGLPLTLAEWSELGKSSKEIWETCYQDWRIKDKAINALYIGEVVNGGTLAVEAVWDILPEDVQAQYLKIWSKQNAEQNKQPNDGANSTP